MEFSGMPHLSTREEEQDRHSAPSRPVFSYDQFNIAFGGGAEWDLPNLETTTWSSSGQTLSPTSTLYSPAIIDSTNPFDHSFQETQLGTSPTISFVKNEIFSDSAFVYPMTEPLGISHVTETENWKEIPPIPFPDQQMSTRNIPSPTATSKTPQPTPQFKPQSRPTRTRSAKKSYNPTPPPPKRKSTGQTTKVSKSRSSPSPSVCENAIGRLNHNLIEKKYRNRLNKQFDILLSVLPAGAALKYGDEESSKRVSKAEVLILAKERIETLEREKREICEEKGRLKKSLDDLKMAL